MLTESTAGFSQVGFILHFAKQEPPEVLSNSDVIGGCRNMPGIENGEKGRSRSLDIYSNAYSI